MPALEGLGFVFEFAFVRGEYRRLGYEDWERGMGWMGWVFAVLGVCGLRGCEVGVEEVQVEMFRRAKDDGMEALRRVKGRFLEEVRGLLCRERYVDGCDDAFDAVQVVLAPEMCRGEEGRLRAFLERRYRALATVVEADKLVRLVDYSVSVLMGDISIDVI